MAYMDVLEDIEKLPRYREFSCHKCGKTQQAYSLQIQSVCIECGTRVKLRGFSAVGSEVEDIIDAVLLWIGKDQDFSAALQRKSDLDKEGD